MKLRKLLKEVGEQQQNPQQQNQPTPDMIDSQPGVADKRQAITYIEQTSASFKELYSRLKIMKDKIYSSTDMRESDNYDKIQLIVTEFEKLYREFNEIALKSKSMA